MPLKGYYRTEPGAAPGAAGEGGVGGASPGATRNPTPKGHSMSGARHEILLTQEALAASFLDALTFPCSAMAMILRSFRLSTLRRRR